MNQATKTLAYDDLCLTCIGCNQPFDYPATEQDFFAQHGLDDPKRCRRCRSMKQGNDKQSPYPTGNFSRKQPQPPQRQQQRPAHNYLPGEKDEGSSNRINELKSEVRKIKLELDELTLEMKEMRLYIRSRKVAQMEKAAAAAIKNV